MYLLTYFICCFLILFTPDSCRWSSDKRWAPRAWNGGKNWIWCELSLSAVEQLSCQCPDQHIPALLRFQVHYQLKYFNVANILRDSVLNTILPGHRQKIKAREKFLKFWATWFVYSNKTMSLKNEQKRKKRTYILINNLYYIYICNTYHVKQVP